MTTQLKDFFRQRYSSTEEELEKLSTLFKAQKVAKEEILINSGERCKYLYFIIKGSLKACFINENGQETIRFISFENAFITTFHGFIDQIPTNETICACEKSEVLAISHSDFKIALESISFFKDFYIFMLERTYVINHWRIESFLRMDAKQRYSYIIEQKPHLIQRLSNKNLAHYIGITQESLSRIKAKL